MISDLHFGIGLSVEKAKGQFVTLCRKIRSDFSLEDTILFIIMGDIIFRGDTAAFSDARICLDCIREELGGRTVKFEFLPGNHDLTNGNFDDFDKFTAEYGSSNPFGRTGVYSKTYDDVNFIFADSNLSRDHRLPGKLDIEAIRTEAKKTLNLLFAIMDSHIVMEMTTIQLKTAIWYLKTLNLWVFNLHFMDIPIVLIRHC